MSYITRRERFIKTNLIIVLFCFFLLGTSLILTEIIHLFLLLIGKITISLQETLSSIVKRFLIPLYYKPVQLILCIDLGISCYYWLIHKLEGEPYYYINEDEKEIGFRIWGYTPVGTEDPPEDIKTRFVYKGKIEGTYFFHQNYDLKRRWKTLAFIGGFIIASMSYIIFRHLIE